MRSVNLLFVILLGTAVVVPRTVSARRVRVADANVPYPPHDEYVFTDFNPDNLYGVPYGGFARATESRLSKLSLQLSDTHGFEFRTPEPPKGTDANDEEEKSDRSGAGSKTKEARRTTDGASAPHFTMRNGDGRLFACRVYKEEELTPSSARASVFEPAVLKGEEDKSSKTTTTKTTKAKTKPKTKTKTKSSSSSVPSSSSSTTSNSLTINRNTDGTWGGEPTSPPKHEQFKDFLENAQGNAVQMGVLYANLLTKMSFRCLNLHTGWWSYEWCDGKSIRQYHVEESRTTKTTSANGGDSNPGNTKYKITDKIMLGKFKNKAVVAKKEIDIKGGTATVSPDGSTSTTPAADDADQLVVVHEFAGGDVCEETGRDRRVTGEVRCCTDKDNAIINKARRNGVTFQSEAVFFLDVSEKSLCAYAAKACSPLLCPDNVAMETAYMVGEDRPLPTGMENLVPSSAVGSDADTLRRVMSGEDLEALQEQLQTMFAAGGGGDGGVGGGRDPQNIVFAAVDENGLFDLSSLLGGKNEKEDEDDEDDEEDMTDADTEEEEVAIENESIRQILKRTLGNQCLSKTVGWWHYEFCHLRHVREFHPRQVFDQNIGHHYYEEEDEHYLGKYDSELNAVANDDEEKVIRASSSDGDDDLLDPTRRPSSSNDGERDFVHFRQEYSHGDVCADEDVTETAIKAGHFVDGGVERSTMVRFSCGKRKEIVRVNEDSTCHYVFDVTVPDLCRHPAFRVRQETGQVVKCLPVDEEEADDEVATRWRRNGAVETRKTTTDVETKTKTKTESTEKGTDGKTEKGAETETKTE